MRITRTLSYVALIFLMVFFLASCRTNEYPTLAYGAEGTDTSLLVVQSGNLFGYADPTGKIFIKPQYADARPFCEGLAAVRKGAKYGYIDKAGKVLLPFMYVEAFDFHNGRAIVGIGYVKQEGYKLTKYSLIDNGGSILKEMNYSWIGEFTDGVTVVTRFGKNDLLYLDENYNEVNLPGEGHITEFHEGISDVMGESDLDWFVDRQGNQVGDKYFYTQSFSEGLAAVRDGDKYGYIDKTGKIVIQPQYHSAGPFGEGLACVMTNDHEFEIIDVTGKPIFVSKDTTYGVDIYGKFSEGLCSVIRHGGDMSWNGFIDKTGKLVIDCIYSRVTPFKNGIAQVLLNGKIGYIDKTGKYIWEPK